MKIKKYLFCIFLKILRQKKNGWILIENDFDGVKVSASEDDVDMEYIVSSNEFGNEHSS